MVLWAFTISEVKKKGKGRQSIGKRYTLIYEYSGQIKRAKVGEGTIISYIDDIDYVNDHMLRTKVKKYDRKVYLISVYASDSSKTKEKCRRCNPHLPLYNNNGRSICINIQWSAT